MFLSSVCLPLLYYSSSSSFTLPALIPALVFFPLKGSFLSHLPVWGSPFGFLTHLSHSTYFFRHKRDREHNVLPFSLGKDVLLICDMTGMSTLVAYFILLLRA